MTGMNLIQRLPAHLHTLSAPSGKSSFLNMAIHLYLEANGMTGCLKNLQGGISAAPDLRSALTERLKQWKYAGYYRL